MPQILFRYPAEKNLEDLQSMITSIRAEVDLGEQEAGSVSDSLIQTLASARAEYGTMKPRQDGPIAAIPLRWPEKNLLVHLIWELDADITDIRTETGEGVLEFEPFAFPYGGMEGMAELLRSFNCMPYEATDSTGIYSVDCSLGFPEFFEK